MAHVTVIRIETLIAMAHRATEGMTDYRNVEPTEDAAVAAREIVDYWENEGELLNYRDTERFAELGGTDADLGEIRERAIDIIERAIIAHRKQA